MWVVLGAHFPLEFDWLFGKATLLEAENEFSRKYAFNVQNKYCKESVQLESIFARPGLLPKSTGTR